MKNWLIIGSARSGTHALGSHMATAKNLHYLGEICKQDGESNAVQDMTKFLERSQPTLAQLVQFASKVKLSHMVPEIKAHCRVISLRRRNKVDQFASWIYFHKTGGVLRSWHNHRISDMLLEPKSITASDEEIDQFIVEQIVDDFFVPDEILYYEDLSLAQSKFQKNQYAWDLKMMFVNLEKIQNRLGSWTYNE